MPRYIRQVHDHGCAVATIAMVTGASYQDVLKRAFPRGFRRLRQPGRAFDIGIPPKKMVRLIKSYGVKAQLTRRRRHLTNTSILLFEWFPPADLVEGFHCVVWDPSKEKVLDPGWVQPLGSAFYFSRWRASGRTAIEIQAR